MDENNLNNIPEAAETELLNATQAPAYEAPAAPAYEAPAAPVYDAPAAPAYQAPAYDASAPAYGAPAYPAAEPPKKKKTGLIIGIAAAAVAVIVALILLLSSGGKNPEKAIVGNWDCYKFLTVSSGRTFNPHDIGESVTLNIYEDGSYRLDISGSVTNGDWEYVSTSSDGQYKYSLDTINATLYYNESTGDLIFNFSDYKLTFKK